MIQARYFDGRSTRVQTVTLSGNDRELAVDGAEVHLRIPVERVVVDERLGRAARRIRFEDGTFCEVADLAALDGLLTTMGHRDGWVDRVQRNLASALLAVGLCALIAFAGYRWGLPWVAEKGAARLPSAVGRTLSAQTLKLLDGNLLLPTQIDPKRLTALEARFHALILPEGGSPASELLFRASPALGANAFTMPDGTIIVLDDLVKMLADDGQIVAVFAHELGHAHGRHGLQQLFKSSAVGAFLTLYVGDISSLLAAAPAALVQARYSQQFEREADNYGAAVLIRNGLSPGLLADALGKLSQAHPHGANLRYLSTHPSTEERIERLRSLAGPPNAHQHDH